MMPHTSFEERTMAKSRIKTFCNSCSRPEWHRPQQVSLLIMTLTLGAVLLVRPYRCTCCGALRFGAGKAGKQAAH